MIAQSVPSEGLSYDLFEPLLLVAVVYAVLLAVGRALEGRGDPRGRRLGDVAFGLLLLAAAYVVVLAVIAVSSEYELVWDMLVTTAVIAVFFLLLLGLLLTLVERGVGVIGRLRRRRR